MRELEDSAELAALRRGALADAAVSPISSTATKDHAGDLPVSPPIAARAGSPVRVVFPVSVDALEPSGDPTSVAVVAFKDGVTTTSMPMLPGVVSPATVVAAFEVIDSPMPDDGAVTGTSVASTGHDP